MHGRANVRLDRGHIGLVEAVGRHSEIVGIEDGDLDSAILDRLTNLILIPGADAYSEAWRRQGEGGSKVTANDWSRVALAVARRTGKRVGLDTSTRGGCFMQSRSR